MKRKIITRKQLDRLVKLGVVKKDEEGYLFDGCYLFCGDMDKKLLGFTLEVTKVDAEDFPYEASGYFVPYFILASNYKKMLANAEEVIQLKVRRQEVRKWGV